MSESIEKFSQEVATGARFEFGANWERFLASLTEQRIEQAINAMRTVLQVKTLEDVSFLDIGSGSGLFSLSARRMGAGVTSFDFDPTSVACTRKLREFEKATDVEWRVLQGSILDDAFVSALGTFDVVYSWGVLHHTGQMWKAIGNAARLVRPGGKFCLAIYNDQGTWSHVWLRVKRLYNGLPKGLKWTVAIPTLVQRWAITVLRDILAGAPLRSWKTYGKDRGMSPWHDLIDWVGGLPFEVAKPEAIFDFLFSRGFTLVYLKTCAGGIGCNEFSFVRTR